MMCVCDLIGVIAVALTEKRTEDSPMFESEDSFIVFYSFSDSSHAQVWKVMSVSETA